MRRSGSVAYYEPIEIDALPEHQSSSGSEPLPAARPNPASQQRSASPRQISERNLPGLSIQGELARGQSLAALLQKQGVGASTIYLISREMKPLFDFRRSQPGDGYFMTRNMAGDLTSFRYWQNENTSFYLYRSGDGFEVREENTEYDARLARLEGEVDSSLYLAIRQLGEDPSLASEFADIFAWDIDFTRQLHAGDRFEMVYEDLYRVEDDGSETHVGPGRILAARFTGRSGDHTAVYFEERDGLGGYFRPDGTAIARDYLLAPVAFSRISSNYSPARHHPILKVVRPHNGIDYAASEGTPVWSVADGRVIFRGWSGGFGNLVKIRHANGLVSYYAHLSRFPAHLKVGQKVHQKDTIGYVGHTGLATGPHVCFRVRKNGTYVNPRELNRGRPASKAVADESWGEFEAVRDQLLTGLQGGGLELADIAL